MVIRESGAELYRMKADDNKYVKVQFRYFSNVLGQETVENLWATVIDDKKGYYKLDSIPFYGPLVSFSDIVQADYDKSAETLIFKEVIKYSGNSVIQVLMTDEALNINDIRDHFRLLGCPSEKDNEKYFVIDVPVEIEYSKIRTELEKLEKEGIIEFAEPFLSEQHKM